MLIICRKTVLGLLFAFQSAIAVLPKTSNAVLIDDFSVDQGPLSNLPCATPPPRSSVTDDDIAGTERDAQAGSSCGGGLTGATSFEVSAGIARTSAETNGMGQSRLDYDGPGSPFDLNFNLNIDLSDGGSSDRFIIDISAVTGTASILINVGPTVGGLPFLQQSWIAIAAPGTMEIPFADFIVVGSPPPAPSFNPAVAVQVSVSVGAESAVEIDRICTGNAVAKCILSPLMLYDGFED